MKYRVTFAIGFATGFLAGARAGRERYEQIIRVARRIADNPTVQQAAGAIQAQASTLTETARNKVTGQLNDKLPWRRPGKDPGSGDGAFVPAGARHDGAPAPH